MNQWIKSLLVAGAAGATAAYVGRTMLRRHRWFSFEGRTVLITGGSRGLGLVLARELVDVGAQIAICARTQNDIDAATEELRQRGGSVIGIRCDVRDRDQVQTMVQQVRRTLGPIDVLFNVAGVIEVGPLDAMTRDDFDRAMDTHCWGPLNTVLAVLPQMRQRGWGRIVNVASIGGKQAVPHLLPYCASKFALVGLSNGLRTELAKDGILVTTICPGLMRTGSPRNAIFKSQHRKEYTWFSIGDSLPVLAMSAESAAEQILRACQNGDGEVIVKHPANISMTLQSLLPGLTSETLALINRMLPEMGGLGQRAARGYDSHSEWSPSWLTQLTELAAQRNNEMRRHPLD